MSSFTVRDVEERDLDQLLGLYRQLAEGDVARMPAGAEASREVLRRIIGDRSRHLCVATDGDDVVGSAELIVVPNLTHRASPWDVIENVIVNEAVRGGGRAPRCSSTSPTSLEPMGATRPSSTPASSALTPIANTESSASAPS